MLLHTRCLNRKLLDTVIYDLIDRRVIQDEARLQVLVVNGNTRVILDGQASEDTITTTVLGDHTETCIHRVSRALDLHFLAMHFDGS